MNQIYINATNTVINLGEAENDNVPGTEVIRSLPSLDRVKEKTNLQEIMISPSRNRATLREFLNRSKYIRIGVSPLDCSLLIDFLK